jgi:hypothetical protein
VLPGQAQRLAGAELEQSLDVIESYESPFGQDLERQPRHA